MLCAEIGNIGIKVYLIIVNIIGFALMGIDKAKAKKQAWRIPEKTLFVISIIGGSVGAWAGMYVFHHKTRHWYFVIGIPLILIAQVILLVVVYRYSNI